MGLRIAWLPIAPDGWLYGLGSDGCVYACDRQQPVATALNLERYLLLMTNLLDDLPPDNDRLMERVQIFGIPATLVAESYLVLPGDERVPVRLTVDMNHGIPALRLDFDDVRGVIEGRKLRG